MAKYFYLKQTITTLTVITTCIVVLGYLKLIRYEEGKLIIHVHRANPNKATSNEQQHYVPSAPQTTLSTQTEEANRRKVSLKSDCQKLQPLDVHTKALVRNALEKAVQLKELFRHQSEKLKSDLNETVSILAYFERLSKPLENSLMNDLELLHNITSTDDHIELKELNEIAQSMIHRSQNPIDCRVSRKLHCSIKHTSCGFGCLMHDYGLCTFVAVGKSRCMQYDMKQLTAYPGISSMFKYTGNTCVNTSHFGESIEWRSPHSKKPTLEEAEVIKMTIDGPYTSHSLFSPGTVPEKLLPRIERVHGDPRAWWIGHVMNYFLRPQQLVEDEFTSVKREIQFAHPIVGIHIRRRDKISEAPYYDLERYMDHVESWYGRYFMKHPSENVIRRVYLATDASEVVEEAKIRYPKYAFITALGKLFKESQNRQSASAVKCIWYDVLLLRDCDFAVVTFSSNVGRLVYELKQNSTSDQTYSVLSLDDRYHYWGEIGQVQFAIADHNPPSDILCKNTLTRAPMQEMRKWTCELELKAGDELVALPTLYHVYLSGGYNRRTKLHGLYPAHKVKDVVTPAPYPL
uniref:GT23 domain-containing protein n=1 Tax=Ciona intestinalis TaxID=7719 RepID=H2Y0J1_CIOIN